MGRKRRGIVVAYPTWVQHGRLILPLLLVLSCEDPTYLTRCGNRCYAGPGKPGKGRCAYGTQECDEFGNLTKCVNATYASSLEDLCDFVDSDCDGRTDEDFVSERCGSDEGACAASHTECVVGEIVCANALGPGLEECNGVDDDCDGYVDELEDLPVSFCYTGSPPESALNPPCGPGVFECVLGNWVCRGETRPLNEDICGDGIDNDCDSFTDETTNGTEIRPWDVVVVFDQSGSMDEEQDIAKPIWALFLASNSARRDIRFWLIDLPAYGSLSYDFNPICHPHPPLTAPFPFCPLPTFAAAVANLSVTNGGIEPSYDAFLDIALGSVISWTPNSKKVIMFFGDEHGQTNGNADEMDVSVALMTEGITFYGFVYSTWWSHYDDIATDTGGMLFLDYETLSTLLPEEFVPVCD